MKKIIHRALDGEVTRTETRRLRRDAQARAEIESLKQVVHASEKVHVDVPPGFTKKVLKGLDPGKK